MMGWGSSNSRSVAGRIDINVIAWSKAASIIFMMKYFIVSLTCFIYYASSIFHTEAQKQGQTWKSNMDGLDRVMVVTAVNYIEGTFAGKYGIMNSDMDELRGTFDKDGGNIIGWTVAYRNSYLYGTQVWSGHFVNSQGTNHLAIRSLSIRTGPGYSPSYITSEYFIQYQEEEFNNEHFQSRTYRKEPVVEGSVAQGQVWINRQKDEIFITKVDSENGTFAGEFKRARDKTSTAGYNIRGELGKDGSTLGWSVIYVYEDQQKLDYRNSIVWCGHIDSDLKSPSREMYAMWLNTTEYKELQNYIVTNVGIDKFMLKSNNTGLFF